MFLTFGTNYLLIPIYGITGAAIATAISVFLFNSIKILLLKIKLNMQPFSKQTFLSIILLLIIYLLVQSLMISGYVFIDIVWRSTLVLFLFTPAMIKLNLSEDINKTVKEIWSKIF